MTVETTRLISLGGVKTKDCLGVYYRFQVAILGCRFRGSPCLFGLEGPEPSNKPLLRLVLTF